MNVPEHISHEQAIELLPWLLTGSMQSEELAKVRAHAVSCVICKRELQELEVISDVISDEAGSQPVPPPDMRNINARIDRLVEREGRLRTLISRLGGGILQPWRLAFAIQTAVVVALAAVVFWPGSDDAEYVTLTQPQQMPDGHFVRIVFNPDMSLSELAGLLEESGLTVADGPSARGVYTLGAPEGLSESERALLLAKLQQEPGVLFAQWVAGRDN